MSHPIQRHQSMEPLNDNSQLNEKLLVWKSRIQILCTIMFLCSTLFMQFLCMIRRLCQMTGILASADFERSILALYFIQLAFLYLINHSITNVNISIIVWIKYPIFLLLIAIIVLGITSFANTSRDVTTQWNSLGPIAQSQYNQNIGRLQDINSLNQLLIGIYHCINFGLLMLIGLSVYQYQLGMPPGLQWRPPRQYQPPQPMPLIYKDLKKALNEQIEENQARQEDDLPENMADNIFMKVPSRPAQQKRQSRFPKAEESEEQQLNQEPQQQQQIQNQSFQAQRFDLTPEKDDRQQMPAGIVRPVAMAPFGR